MFFPAEGGKKRTNTPLKREKLNKSEFSRGNIQERMKRMIRIENLVKRFGDFTALKDVSMTIDPGSIYGLVGSNGAGKSTLMRCIAGIYEPEEGHLSVDSEPVYENPEMKEKILLVADEPWFIQQSNLHTMKRFYQRFYPSFDQDIYDELVEGFALPERKKISAFSKGMKRQAAFLLGMAAKPQFLMLDECFDGLDPVKRQIVRKVICDAVADRQMTAIISSHNLKELDEICDTVGILHQGSLLYSKDLDSLKGEVHKVQVVFLEEVSRATLEALLPVMAMEVRGKFFTLIVRGSMEEIEEKLSPYRPAALEAVPLSLEEVFLYEMEVMGYDANVLFKD